MDFGAYQVWEGIVHFGALAVLLLTANILRRKIPFLRRSLLPTAVIAGFIGLLIKETFFIRQVTPDAYARTELFLRVITYHTIALGFIALGLKVKGVMQVKPKKGRSMFSGMIIVSTYMIQGFIGLVLSLTMAYTIFPNLFKASGLLLPMGLGQGPGQAQNIGNVYETLPDGFVGGTTFGLAIASFGFIWASVVGVIYLNILLKQGKIKRKTEQKAHMVSSQEIESPDEIPVAEAIDKFTIQIALVLMVYLTTFLFILGFQFAVGRGMFGAFGASTILPLILGFNFIIGMLFALAYKQLFLWLRKQNIMTRQYPNNYMLNRIAGLVFDFMIVASITAIRVEDLADLWIPFIVMTLSAGVATFFYVTFICKRVYPEYPHAATMGMFGMLSGTASTGVVLLREVDPNFKTPAANDLVIGSSTAILFGFPILLLVGIAPISTAHTLMTLGIIIVLSIILIGLLLKFNPKTPIVEE